MSTDQLKEFIVLRKSVWNDYIEQAFLQDNKFLNSSILLHQVCPLLKGMLEMNRKERTKIENVIECLRAIIESYNAAK